jgi:tetratricopeptide (TPR) repeat protein
MKKLICSLMLLPILVGAERAAAQTSDGSASERAGVVAERAGSAEKLSAYQHAGDWQHFAELIEATMKKFPPQYGEHAFAEAVGVGVGGDSWALNSRAWDVFRKCDDKAVLTKALGWIELSIGIARPITHPETEPYPVQSLDTKANLLYKLGRVEEAIATEQAAIAQDIANAKKAGTTKGGFLFDEYSATVEKMRKGEPTWPAK